MRYYTKNLIREFIKEKFDVRASETVLAELAIFEKRRKDTEPDINIDALIERVCREMDITVEEYHTEFKYGKLPYARHFVCYLLSKKGLRNIQISHVTGYSPARVTISVLSAEDYINNHPQMEGAIIRIAEELNLY